MDTSDLAPQSLVLLPRTSGGDPGLETFLDDAFYTSTSPDWSSQAVSYATTEGSRVGKAPDKARPRLERKSHTKSRRGCFSCKRRRIKCSEGRPACAYCIKKGLNCEYPPLPQIIHQPHDQVPLFSFQDMRCFQHFMLQCYPHTPPGDEDVWTHEVPCLSRSHEHLMHAILAVAASDIANTDPALMSCALVHRLKAIESIKRTLADMPVVTHESANALLATCLALTVQSVGLDDGMVEYMTFVRGLMVVGMEMWKGGFKPIFTNLVDAQAVLGPHMVTIPLIPGTWTDAAVRAIEGLCLVCTGPLETEYRSMLLDWARTLYVSSWEAYKALEKHCMWWVLLPHASFQPVIDPTNQAMVLLASHWIALQHIMASVTAAHAQVRKKEPKKRGTMEEGMTRWLRYHNGMVDGEHAVYNGWPMWVQCQLEKDPGAFGKPV